MLLPRLIYDTESMWGSHALQPITHWVSAVRPKEKATSHYFLCLYSHGNRKWNWGETSGLFWVNVIYLFFSFGFLMFYSFFFFLLTFSPFWNKGFIWSPLDFSIGSSKTLDQALDTDMDFFPHSFVSVLLWSLVTMPCAFTEVLIVSLSTAFEGMFPLLFLMFHSCQQHPRYNTNILGSREGSLSLFTGDKGHGRLREKGIQHILQQCQGHFNCMQKYKWAFY